MSQHWVVLEDGQSPDDYRKAGRKVLVFEHQVDAEAYIAELRAMDADNSKDYQIRGVWAIEPDEATGEKLWGLVPT